MKRPAWITSWAGPEHGSLRICECVLRLLRFVFALVSQGQDLFANALRERLELLHRVANTRSRRLVAVPIEFLEVRRHGGDEPLQFCVAVRRGRGLGLG